MSGDRLAVLLRGELVGSLVRERGRIRFLFDRDVVERYQGLPLLSTSLPVRSEAFDARSTASWFGGLLPEGSRLDEARRFFAVESDDYFDVLGKIGWECAGAVEVVPPDVAPGRLGGFRERGSDDAHPQAPAASFPGDDRS